MIRVEKTISIGKILNFHGINGEARVGYTVGNENIVKNTKKVFVLLNGKKIPLTVVDVRFHKKHALIKFKEINSVNELIEIKGCNIMVEKTSVQEALEEDEYLNEDLIGLSVYDTDENLLGTVKYIADQASGSLLAIETLTQKTSLVPFVKDLVPTVDIKNKKIVVKNIEGLIEI